MNRVRCTHDTYYNMYTVTCIYIYTPYIPIFKYDVYLYDIHLGRGWYIILCIRHVLTKYNKDVATDTEKQIIIS